MLDHISFGVSGLAQSIAFYDATMRRYVLSEYGPQRIPRKPLEHLAFSAAAREAAPAFHAAGIAHGAVDEGAPALCPEYGENYFAAFLRDPMGTGSKPFATWNRPTEKSERLRRAWRRQFSKPQTASFGQPKRATQFRTRGTQMTLRSG
jgi:catechol 2,3-dioxygenase-like lactoylglutathione lyase family enzyme